MSKKRFVDSIRVSDPCTEDWNEMVGNAKVRFCSHCALHVNNLSEMSKKEAIKLVKKSRGRICIRYIQDPITFAPLFAGELVQISRRVSRVAASVMSASLSVTSVAYAQFAPPEPWATDAEIVAATIPGTTEGNTARIGGVVTDPNGAVIPGARIFLLRDGNVVRQMTTNDDGRFEFDDVTDADYSLRVESPGFMASLTGGIRASQNGSEQTFSLQLGAQVALSGAVAIRVYEQPLVRAVGENDIEEVRRLIATGVDVNAREEVDRTTPLMVAVQNGSLEMARLLLDFGAKINARNSEKQTALMQLDEDATRELVELLIDNGAKVDLKDEDGTTALIFAANWANADVLAELIRAGANVDEKDNEGDTPLIRAAYSDDQERVRVLLLAGADPEVKNNEGETAYDQTSVDEILQMLISFGATPHEKPPDDPDEEQPDQNEY